VVSPLSRSEVNSPERVAPGVAFCQGPRVSSHKVTGKLRVSEKLLAHQVFHDGTPHGAPILAKRLPPHKALRVSGRHPPNPLAGSGLRCLCGLVCVLDAGGGHPVQADLGRPEVREEAEGALELRDRVVLVSASLTSEQAARPGWEGHPGR